MLVLLTASAEVRAIGFPMGGSTICVTKGVVSRLDAQMYVHPNLKVHPPCRISRVLEARALNCQFRT